MSILGPMFYLPRFEDAIAQNLSIWMPTYLRHIEYDLELSYALEDPRSYNVRPEQDQNLENMLPAIMVISPGTSGDPTIDGESNYGAPYEVAVVLICKAPNHNIVRMNRGLYGAAVRAILLQQRGIDSVSDVKWLGEDTDEGNPDQDRTLGVSVNHFTFWVDGIVNGWAGPIDPDTPPGTILSTVETTYLHTSVVGTEEDL